MNKIFILAAVAAAAPAFADASEYAGRLQAMVDEKLAAVAADADVVAAVIARNAERGEVGDADIAEMDAAWREQVGAGDAPLIASVADQPLSAKLVSCATKARGSSPRSS